MDPEEYLHKVLAPKALRTLEAMLDSENERCSSAAADSILDRSGLFRKNQPAPQVSFVFPPEYRKRIAEGLGSSIASHEVSVIQDSVDAEGESYEPVGLCLTAQMTAERIPGIARLASCHDYREPRIQRRKTR